MTCKHLRPIGLMRRRVTRVPNRRRGRMFTLECCGELQPWGTADEPLADVALAQCLQDTCCLWEPGADRDEVFERYVEGFASQAVNT